MSMKDFDWRKRYAPHGYGFVKQRLTFDYLKRVDDPKTALRIILEDMRRKLAKDCNFFFDSSLAHTRITVWPKEIGESLNHIDPLKPRFGIEIEIRQPMPPNIVV